MPEPVIELAGVCRTFAARPPVRALDAVSLQVRGGDYVAVTGPSGSGKSTLLNVLGLLDRPDAGSYRLDGAETTTLPDRARTRLRGDRIGFVFQSFHLLPHRIVFNDTATAEIYTVRNGKIARLCAYYDSATMMRQLGLLPQTGSRTERAMTAAMGAGIRAKRAVRRG